MGYAAVNITDTATLILTANSRRQSHLLMNNDTVNTVYIGGDSSVTDTEAYPLGPLNQLIEDKSKAGYQASAIYGICEAGKTAEVRYWERIRSV